MTWLNCALRSQPTVHAACAIHTHTHTHLNTHTYGYAYGTDSGATRRPRLVIRPEVPGNSRLKANGFGLEVNARLLGPRPKVGGHR